MKIYNGLCRQCKCGNFEWKAYKLAPGEVVACWEDELAKRCIRRNFVGEICYAIVECPKCRKRYHEQALKSDSQ